MERRRSCVALIVAAGHGVRAGEGLPKQYRDLAGKPVLRRTIEVFTRHPKITAVHVVISPEHRKLYDKIVEGLSLPDPISGGATRQESVLAGLTALSAVPPEFVLIHDAARALIEATTISDVIEALAHADGALPVLTVTDTLKRLHDSHVELTLPRDGLAFAQTPQAFHFQKIMSAHTAARDRTFTDDASIAEVAGMFVRAVPGNRSNFKLTTAEDFVFAEQLLATRLSSRIGQGFDVHKFGPGDHVWLCGVKVPHTQTLVGHSDADVALHALTDAILGALAAGDIGQHFPPSDPKWKGAPSHLFLKRASELVNSKGGTIEHVDVTIICEGPKVSPYRDAMAQRVAEILKLDTARVSVKATTTEGLGFTGRKEGIAAQAIATVRLP